MAYTVENLCGLIMRSKLLSPEAVQQLCQRWRQAAADPHDTRAFARWLVEQNQLTEYQAALLLHGYADNFFLGPYKILQRIAKGRMAGVYRAVHVESGQVVALKVLPPSSAKDPTLLGRFLRESELARQLVHPNIVRTFDAGQSHGLYYLVMEYLDGVTLEEILGARRTLTPLETARIGFFVCLALQYLHEKNVVHRDLKPGNLMLVPAPQPGELIRRASVKLLDVGLAREIFQPHHQSRQSDLTTEGSIIGSVDYLAPEQARDPRRVDIRADLYSLGCVLYHCLAGQPPFPDSNPVRALARHSSEPPRPLTEISPQVSGAFWNIIARLLAKNPDHRYPTPAAAAEALRTVLQEQPQLPAVEPSRELQAYLAWLQQRPVAPQTASEPPLKPVKPPPSLKRLKRRRSSNPRVIKLPVSAADVTATSAKPPVAAPSPAASPVPAAPAPSPGEHNNTNTSPPPGASPPLSSPNPPPPGGPAAANFPAASPNPTLAASPAAAVSAPAAPFPAGMTLVNVEPVSAADLLQTPFALPIPRDLFMFLAGALSVLLLVALIWLIVWLAGAG